MEETFKARYIDPMIDWSFKRLFGSEVNKDILIEFLKVIFPEFDIEDITYLPSEQLGIMEKDRRAVFDVICRASDGKEFLVEVQRGAQEHFFERALFYTSFPILKQGKKAMAEEERDTKKPWNFQLDGVFFLGILDYKHLEDDRRNHDRQVEIRLRRSREVQQDRGRIDHGAGQMVIHIEKPVKTAGTPRSST